MNREEFIQHGEELSLNVVQTRVDSIRKKDITKTGLRVYDGGKIGVAGALGRCDRDELTRQAAAALELGIPYPYEPGRDHREAFKVPHTLPADWPGAPFVDEMQALLAELERAQPGFAFSGKTYLRTRTAALRNDLGLDLDYQATSVEISLAIKDKASSNILDAFAGYAGWHYDRAEILRLANMTCDAFARPLPIDDGTYPVLFFNGDPTYRTKLAEALHGQLYGSGASLLADKIGRPLFAPNLTVYESRSWQDDIFDPFFDAEGTVHAGHRCPLIENGTLVAVRTDKKNAARFGLPLTGSAAGDYDSVPALGQPRDGVANLVIANTGKTIRELLDGRKGILVLIAAGGDFTPDGHFATPVQLAYLFDGETMLGRLPPLNLSSHLYDMFGSGFIGVSTDSLIGVARLDLIAMAMEVRRA